MTPLPDPRPRHEVFRSAADEMRQDQHAVMRRAMLAQMARVDRLQRRQRRVLLLVWMAIAAGFLLELAWFIGADAWPR